jgi:hypothetical protein
MLWRDGEGSRYSCEIVSSSKRIYASARTFIDLLRPDAVLFEEALLLIGGSAEPVWLFFCFRCHSATRTVEQKKVKVYKSEKK